ncbi:MAG TPA: sodium:alanine symporter family protein [Chthoniobacterales bacterium]|jgi:AGCS family alanine or glycine:cation symporter
MPETLTTLNNAAASFSNFVWGPWLIVLLFGTHLFLTVRTGFVQKHLLRGIKLSFSRDKEGKGDISQFGALMTALAATIGTGNIIGVAGAVAVGGPGAVCWMWMTGIFGIATKYSEALLAVKYRVQMPDGTMAGGPMYVLERGLKMKWLGVLFAIFTAFAAFGIGNMTQANSIVANLQGVLAQHQIGVSMSPGTIASIIGFIMAALTAAVVLGGVKSISKVCEVLVPFMALFYIAGCILLMIHYGSEVPNAIKLIFTSAFSTQAAVGGFLGATLKQIAQAGIARGLFSNESGLGSAPIVAAAAQTKNAIRQALVSSTGTFWDTVVICMLTGIVLVASGRWDDGLSKSVMTQSAFGDLHTFGPIILTVALLTFVFSTILGWNYYGEKAVEYLFGSRAIKPYRVLWVIAVYFGCVLPNNFVWDLADGLNGLMAIPNLIALILLSGVIAAETKANKAELTGKE